MGRLVTVLSLPWTGRGQRDGEEREEKDAGTERDNLGGRWSMHSSALPVSDHLRDPCIPIPRQNARAKRHICEADIQGVSKLLQRERAQAKRNVGGGISQRYERESPRNAIHKYGNQTKRKENGNLSLQRISRGHRFRRRRLPHPLLKSTHKTPDWEQQPVQRSRRRFDIRLGASTRPRFRVSIIGLSLSFLRTS
jgi:hypothetical protein